MIWNVLTLQGTRFAVFRDDINNSKLICKFQGIKLNIKISRALRKIFEIFFFFATPNFSLERKSASANVFEVFFFSEWLPIATLEVKTVSVGLSY